MIEITRNIKPTKEEIFKIEQKFYRDIKPLLDIQKEILKTQVPVYSIQDGCLVLEPIADKYFLEISSQIKDIKNSYIEVIQNLCSKAE